MELQTKPDLQKTLDRFEAWWRFEVLDRPPVSMSVPSGKAVKWPAQKQYATERDRWFDMEHRLASMEAAVQSRKYVADSLPYFYGNLGPEILATLYGAELEFTADSSWAKPVFHSCRDILKAKPNFDGPYWSWMRKITDLSIEMGKGKWITSITDLHTHADLLAALREPQELLIELIDDYDAVKQAIRHVAPLWDVAFGEPAEKILKAGMPTMSWTPTPHVGRGCVLQADFICMVSPEMFQDVFLPGLVYEIEHLDRSIYHLDGPNALQHLDTLLACPKLNAIQWVYGAGNEPAARWIDVYKRIQAAGKGMQIFCVNIEDALKVAEHVKPNGCFFEVWGSYTEDQVNQFLHRLERWTATGKL
jgi:hypothetical protein